MHDFSKGEFVFLFYFSFPTLFVKTQVHLTSARATLPSGVSNISQPFVVPISFRKIIKYIFSQEDIIGETDENQLQEKMSVKILICLGSVRPNRMADRVAITVKNIVSAQGMEPTILGNLMKNPLPHSLLD